MSEDWFRLSEPEEARVDTPALIVFPERVRRNIDAMLEIAGGPERLRPHVKTHKMAEIVDLPLQVPDLRVARILEPQPPSPALSPVQVVAGGARCPLDLTAQAA